MTGKREYKCIDVEKSNLSIYRKNNFDKKFD
jgi:hypothetical protein